MVFSRSLLSRRHGLLASTAICALVGAVTPALANPNGGTVTRGSASIETGGNTVTIRQTSNRAVIEWQDFSIGKGETTTFVQPDSKAVTLNRVTSDNASMIDGKLTANGNVFLINRNGIMVGAGAVVDVGGLVATTSDIADDAFMAGKNRFDKPTDKPDAAVVNQGTITVADRGLAALVGPTVENDGVIAARLGTVALGSAETFTVDLAGDGLISFDTGQTVDRASGTPQVSNGGVIRAEGGTVILDAASAAGVVDKAIDMTGVIEVSSVSSEGGVIVLSGGDGTTAVSGRLDASGTKGGTVEVTGKTVDVAASAVIDARGTAGGGKIKLGGDLRGQGATPRAETTRVAAGARLDASATGNGDGGTIVVWSDKATDFAGSAKATGGAAGGNGGLIETSSAGRLSVTGAQIDASAAKGEGGEWLLDPADIEIVDKGEDIPPDGNYIPSGPSLISISSIFGVLQTGTNVTIKTTDSTIPGNGDITYSANGSFDLGGAAADLTLIAAGDILWNGTLNVANGDFGLSLDAGKGITWTGVLDGSAARLDLRAVADGSIEIGSGRIIGDDIDLRGCMTVTTCDTYGIAIQPTGPRAPSIEIRADRLTLLGGIGGVAVDKSDIAGSSLTVAVGQMLRLQGFGTDPFSFSTGSFSPASGATVVITPAFLDTDLAVAVSSADADIASSLNNADLDALSGFSSLTVRAGADATFNFNSGFGNGDVRVTAATPDAVLNLPLDIFIELNGGDFLLASDVTIGGGKSLSVTASGDDARIDFLGRTTLSGDLTLAAAEIVLQNDLDIGGGVDLGGNVALAADAVTIDSGTGIDITGTLNGTRDHADAAATLRADSGQISIGGDAGFGFGLGALTVETSGLVRLAGVHTQGDQRYTGSTILLGGTETGADDYLAQAGDIDFTGRVMIVGDIAVTASDGDIAFSSDIRRSDLADTAELTLTAGGLDGEITVAGRIGHVEATINNLFVSASKSFELHDVLTLADQTYVAPLGHFFGEVYRSATGDIRAGGTESGLIAGITSFEAGKSVTLNRIDAVTEGEASLFVTASDGDINFLSTVGGKARPFSIIARATDGITAFDLNASDTIDLAAETIRFTGRNYEAGDSFLATGRLSIEQDTNIDARTLVRLDGAIDLASAGSAGLAARATAGRVEITGSVGGSAPLGYLVLQARDAVSVGSVRTEGQQYYSAADVFLGGDSYVAGGDFTLYGSGRIAGDTTITVQGDALIAGDVDYAPDIGTLGVATPDFTILAGGDLTLAGTVGGTSTLGDVALTAGGNLMVQDITAAGNILLTAGGGAPLAGIIRLFDSEIRAGGALDLIGAVELAGDALLNATGALRVVGTIDGEDAAHALRATGSAVEVTGAIGGRQVLSDLEIVSGEGISLGSVTTSGSQFYSAPLFTMTGTDYSAGGDITVDGDLAIATSTSVAAAGAIDLRGNVEAATAGVGVVSPPDLSVSAGMDLTLGGGIGRASSLGNLYLSAEHELALQDVRVGGDLIARAGGPVHLLASEYTAGGSIVFGGGLALAYDTTITAGGDVDIEGPVDADGLSDGIPSLSVAATNGDISVDGDIGGESGINSVSMTAAGEITLHSVFTQNLQRYDSALVTLAGARYVAGTSFTVTGRTELTRSVSVTSRGDTSFGGRIDAREIVGGRALPAGLVVDAGGNLRVGGAIGSVGILTAIDLAADGDVAMTSAFSSGDIDVVSGGALKLTTATLDAGGDIGLRGAIALINSGSLRAGDNVDIVGTIDTAACSEGPAKLDVLAETGDITLDSALGGSRVLGSVSLEAGDTIAAGDITASGAIGLNGRIIQLTDADFSAGGRIDLAGAVLMAGDTRLMATEDVAVQGSMDAVADDRGRLDIGAETGSITINGTIGGEDQPLALTFTAGDVIAIDGDILTRGDQLYQASSITLSDALLRSRAGAITLDGRVLVADSTTVDAATDLTVTGAIDSLRDEGSGLADVSLRAGDTIAILAPVGQDTPLASFDLEAGAMIDPPNVTTIGPQTYKAPVVILTGNRYQTFGGDFLVVGDLQFTGADVLVDTVDRAGAIGGDITFEGEATGNAVSLRAGNGDILGLDIDFAALTVFDTAGSARMAGRVGGISGVAAAAFVGRPDGIADTYTLNDCVMATSCGGPPPPPPPPPPTDEIPDSVTGVDLPVPLDLPTLHVSPLLVTRTEDLPAEDSFIFSNTAKDALWRLDLVEPASGEEKLP